MLPLYRKIIEEIQNRIANGIYKDSAKLPSETEFMKEFDTSRITVVRALNELESMNIIERKKGKGSFVIPQNSFGSAKSGIISLVLPHKMDFFSGGQQYVYNIANYCEEKNFLCCVHYSDLKKSKEKFIFEHLIDYKVDGAIIYPVGNTNIPTLSQLRLKGFPIVMLDRDFDELNMPTVTSDNYRGAYSAVEYLAGHGHENIGMVLVNDTDVERARYRGYCHALQDNGIALNRTFVIKPEDYKLKQEYKVLSSEEADWIIEKLIENGVTAVFCVNDLTASIIMKSAQAKGIRIPEDLSIVGFDHVRTNRVINQDLTSVSQNFDMISKECVNLMVDRINNPSENATKKIYVPTELYEGNTVKKL